MEGLVKVLRIWQDMPIVFSIVVCMFPLIHPLMVICVFCRTQYRKSIKLTGSVQYSSQKKWKTHEECALFIIKSLAHRTQSRWLMLAHVPD